MERSKNGKAKIRVEKPRILFQIATFKVLEKAT